METLDVCGHSLRFVPGTRPLRTSYRDDAELVVRNDAREFEYLSANVAPGETVVDVGAYVGQYSVLFGCMVGPTGSVISFEPERHSRILLERNSRLNGFDQRIKIEPLALFDSSGTHAFFSRPADSMSSLERGGLGTNSGLSDIRETLVHTVSLDDYLIANQLPDPDWLKIDAEGAEIRIIRGAKRALHGNTKIVCELHPYAWASFKSSFDELLAIVARSGRKISWLDGSRLFDGRPGYGTVVIDR